MKKSSIAIASAFTILMSSGAMFAQPVSTSTTTTTWTNDQGGQLSQSWTTNKYASVPAPEFQPTVGAELPPAVTYYPLPPTFNVPERDRYSYVVINQHPVVVERSTRRVVHVWP